MEVENIPVVLLVARTSVSLMETQAMLEGRDVVVLAATGLEEATMHLADYDVRTVIVGDGLPHEVALAIIGVIRMTTDNADIFIKSAVTGDNGLGPFASRVLELRTE